MSYMYTIKYRNKQINEFHVLHRIHTHHPKCGTPHACLAGRQVMGIYLNRSMAFTKSCKNSSHLMSCLDKSTVEPPCLCLRNPRGSRHQNRFGVGLIPPYINLARSLLTGPLLPALDPGTPCPAKSPARHSACAR